MEFTPMNEFSEEILDESVSIRDIIERYLQYYKWFLVSVIFFVLLAFLYIRYSVPKFKASASILIKEMGKESSFDKLSSIEDIGFFGIANNTLENEIQILKSRQLLAKTIKELKLNTQYFIEDSPYDKEKYPNFPILLQIKSDSGSYNNLNTYLEIYVRSKNKFDLIQFDGKIFNNKNFNDDLKINLGNDELSNIKTVTILFNDDFDEDIVGKTLKIYIWPLNSVVDVYMNKLLIEPVNEKVSNVISLSLTETVKNKGTAIINNLIEQFNADGINDKNLIAQTTTDFLDERLGLISTELTAIEATAAQFKTSKGMIDARTEANYFLQSSTVTESEMVDANTQLQLVNYMLDELNNSNLTDPLPGNIGLADLSIVNMIGEYNQQILQRNRILKSSSTKNPIIINIDSQLGVLRNNLVSSLNNLKSSSQIKINALNRKSGKISSKIASAPKYEKEFKDIVRKQETKNALYLFLLQKREESILSNAVKVNKAKIIDSAYSSNVPVSPKTRLIYLASILLGFIMPIIFIYVKDILDTKVHDENDIKKLKLPYLGDIPYTSYTENLFVSDTDNSNIAESFRYLRTNLNFMLDNKEVGKTVFVTSTLSHEGKTFTAINLSLSLAMSGKKTLLLAMDLRAPRISKYLALENMNGITNYIKNEELRVEGIVDGYPMLDNLDVINSGDIPPNPVELLMSKRVSEIFAYAKENYEYVIVDTAPVGMVTDTIQIGNYADMTIYVIKANYLDKRMLHIPEKLHKESKLQNMAILINGSDHSKGAYGYGYGYGYGDKKERPWYKKPFKNVAL